MDFNSSAAGKETNSGSPFDVQGFKNLLDTLKQSKEQQENKAKPVYNPEE
jgi:hypothetical protein